MSNVKSLFVHNRIMNIAVLIVLIIIKMPWNKLPRTLDPTERNHAVRYISMVLIILNLMLLTIVTPSLSLMIFKNESLKQNNLLFQLPNPILFFTVQLIG